MQQEVNNEILQLTEAICRLHQTFDIDAELAVEILKEQGFTEITVAYVEAVYEQRSKQIKKRMEPWRQNAEKSLYWTALDEDDDWTILWSERYILFYDFCSNDPNHKVKVVDSYNDKSM
jgi:hypothetical protein